MGVRNREYHRRAARQALDKLGAGLVRDESQFYRPARRIRPGIVAKPGKTGKLQGLQLELVFPEEHPLADIFPEAYQ
jgi:hypothetical protein